MPSFDISSDVDWQELDNAINQATKELQQRYDFKGVKCELKLEKKEKVLTLWCSEESKMDAVNDIFQTKCIKRGLSILSFDYKEREVAFGSSVRQKVLIMAGVSKEKGKEIMAALKESKLKVQSQIQDEQVRVTGKNRDDLQSAISFLREKQDALKVPMQFGNFRD
jgi:uncharacterized protein YajQ (UPF0234 family)